MSKLIDLVGKQFSALTVLRFAGSRPNPTKGVRCFWLCRCECGNETEIDGGSLRRGSTKSCGCHQHAGIHGMSEHPLYAVWLGIKQRCYNPNADCYSDYGGRGVRMLEEWRESFAAFYAYVGDRPSPLHTIERMNNDGNYEPGNVKWATRSEQNENTRQTRLITFNGITLSLGKWARRAGLQRKTLASRLDRFGWPVERALTTPARHISR